MRKGLFGGMFDFNRDGKLDIFERAAEMQFVDELRLTDELTEAGLDVDELRGMDTDSRDRTILRAGLDPEDYSLLFL